jgi:hypothetical protein
MTLMRHYVQHPRWVQEFMIRRHPDVDGLGQIIAFQIFAIALAALLVAIWP